METIGFVETHGTATAVGDVVEVGALKEFFRRRQARPVARRTATCSSVKANIGHTMSAAGIAGFIKAALVLHHKNHRPPAVGDGAEPQAGAGPFSVPDLSHRPRRGRVDLHPRRAAVSSFGFGGTNAHLVLEEAPDAGGRVQARPVDVRSPPRPPPELFLLSAATPELLGLLATRLHETLTGDPALELPAVAEGLARRALLEARAAIVAQTREELLTELELLQGAAAGLTAPTRLSPRLFAAPVVPVSGAPNVAFLLPGQGAQRVGLYRELFQRSARFAQRLQELDAAAASAASGVSVLDALYPDRSGRAVDLAAAGAAQADGGLPAGARGPLAGPGRAPGGAGCRPVAAPRATRWASSARRPWPG